MSTAKKQQRVSVTTPVGKVEWFSLNKTDQFGNYTCVLHLEESPETLKLISIIDSVGEGKKPYEKQADGSFKIRMKSRSKGTKKTGETYTVNPPVVYNALGKKLSSLELENLSIGNGSEMRAKLEFSTYAMFNQETQEIVKGVSSKIKSAQLGKIVEFSGGGDLGFDALELDSVDLGEESSDNFDF